MRGRGEGGGQVEKYFRKGLQIFLYLVEEMDEADEELRQTLRKMWPLKAKKNMIDLVVPPNPGLLILLANGSGWLLMNARAQNAKFNSNIRMS